MCWWERFQKCVRTIKKIIMKNTHKKTFLNMQNVPSRKDFKSVPDVPGLSIPYYMVCENCNKKVVYLQNYPQLLLKFRNICLS